MFSRSSFGTPGRLALLFVAVTTVPLATLAWLGSWTLAQERALDEQRMTDGLRQSAALLAPDINAATQEWRRLAVDDPDALIATIGGTATVLGFTSVGVTTARGAPVIYVPLRFTEDTRDGSLHSAERAEFVTRDDAEAMAEYRRAARSHSSATRAAALVGLGRCQQRGRDLNAALDTYRQLESLGGTNVAGFPAALVARRERAALLASFGRLADVTVERSALRETLLAGTYRVDRATFDALWVDLADDIAAHAARTKADAIAEAWPAWQRSEAGTAIVGPPERQIATVWTTTAAGGIAVVAPLASLMAPISTKASALGLTVVLGTATTALERLALVLSAASSGP